MRDPAFFLCNSARPVGPEWDAAEVVDYGHRDSVINLDAAAFDGLVSGIAPAHTCARIRDLLDIAAYVYAADCRLLRSEKTTKSKPDTYGQDWRRQLCFTIGVRDPDFWSSENVLHSLTELLAFVSEDTCTFSFTGIAQASAQSPLGSASDLLPADDVILFSGGLDSLAGALEKLSEDRRVCLVSHVSSSKTGRAQVDLVRALKQRFGAGYVQHVSLPLDLQESFRREWTHRTRAFLFAALASAVATGAGRHECLFFENGPVSLNLPIAAAVAGTRATRTTHPQTLGLLSRLVSLASGRDFRFKNPFFELTKTDVIQVFERRAAADLIRRSRSCAKTMFASVKTPHCGECSQCIDRRFAVLAARLEAFDPESSYKIELLLGERTGSTDSRTAIAYLETAKTIHDLDMQGFVARYPEVQRVLDFLDRPPSAAVQAVYNVHKRHAQAVMEVVTEAIVRNASAIAEQRLRPTCLLQKWQSREAGSVAPADAPAGDQKPVRPPLPPFDIWFDPADLLDRDCNLLNVGTFKGAEARLLLVLATRLQRDRLAGQEPSLISAKHLSKALRGVSQEQVRQIVRATRRSFSALMKAAGAQEPGLNDLIENRAKRGYRFNPNAIGAIRLRTETSSSDRRNPRVTS